MTGITLALAARAVDRALESAAIAGARLELAGHYLSRQVGGAGVWAVVLWGVRRG